MYVRAVEKKILNASKYQVHSEDILNPELIDTIESMTVDLGVRKELTGAFGPTEDFNDDVIEKLSTLMQIFNLSSEDLFVHWESFNVTKVQNDLDLTLPNLDLFQEHLQSTLVNASSKATPSIWKVKDLQSSTMRRKPIIRSSADINSSSPANGIPSTPSLKKRKVVEETPAFKTPQLKMESSPINYATANNTFQSPIPEVNNNLQSSPTPLFNKLLKNEESNTVIETLNPDIEELPGYMQLDEDPSTAIKPYRLASNFDASKFKYRTMSMKLLESADVLDDQIDSMTQLFQESQESTDLQFGDPCLCSQFDILCCGRIVPDSPLYDKSGNQALNATTLYLETSRLTGIGQRIPLNMNQLEEYSFFPGQIVCLKGRNPTGQSFIVQEVLPLPELGAPLSNGQELDEYKEMTNDSGLKLFVASGPYSNQHALNYERLNALVDRINTEIKPHLVILFGPFIDITNVSVSKGDIELPDEKQQPKDLDEVFKKCITPIIRKVNPRIQVVMIPSLKDSSIKHCSYPQDSFDKKKFGLPKNVKIFPNPSSFSINEVLVGCSNLDIFKDLKDVFKGATDGNSKFFNNRFERIANHVFEQRRYYPVFPGSMKKNMVSKDNDDSTTLLHEGLMGEELTDTGIGGSSLEVPYMGLTELGDSLPDILVIPSELKFFVKVIKGVIVINPGSFIRGNRDQTKEDGSYAILNIKSPDTSESSDNNVEKVDAEDLYYHNVHQRTRVDIYKA